MHKGLMNGKSGSWLRDPPARTRRITPEESLARTINSHFVFGAAWRRASHRDRKPYL